MAAVFTHVDGCSYCVAAPRRRTVLALDVDHTLIRPKGGRKHPRGVDDWEWAHPNAVAAVAAAAVDADVVLFSNQSGATKPAKLEAICTKLGRVMAALGVPASAFVAVGYSRFRKPKPAMWELYRAAAGGADPVAVTFVGDAAGRPGDFADSDLAFARNIGAEFLTPEAFFAGAPRGGACALRTDPTDWMALDGGAQRARDAAFWAAGTPPELVLMCGAPGSGKSAWIRRTAPLDYKVVSRDVLGTKAKCLRAIREALAEGVGVIVDNTFPTRAARAEYQVEGVPARCVVMRTDPAVAEHLNAMRADHPVHAKNRVPPLVVRMFRSRFEEPTPAEGFAQVHTVAFAYDPAETPERVFAARHA